MLGNIYSDDKRCSLLKINLCIENKEIINFKQSILIINNEKFHCSGLLEAAMSSSILLLLQGKEID